MFYIRYMWGYSDMIMTCRMKYLIDLNNPTTWYGAMYVLCILLCLYLVCFARPYNLIINAGRGSTPDRKSPRYLPWLISVTPRFYYDSIWYSVLEPTPLLIINACRGWTSRHNNPPGVCLLGNPPTNTNGTKDRWCHRIYSLLPVK